MKNKSLLMVILILVVIVIGIGGFYAGIKYQESKLPSFGQLREGMRQQGTLGTQPEGLGTVRGEIISQDEESITVKLPDDSSKIVLISEDTEITKAAEGTVDDLEVGKQVVIFGQENSDGSVTAQNIQLGLGPK